MIKNDHVEKEIICKEVKIKACIHTRVMDYIN